MSNDNSDLINLTINGQSISVPKGTTVYQAAKQQGIEIPIFCYQDRMPPFGACRMCLVEVEKMPKLQTSCTLEATEGMVVNTQSDAAVQGQQSIIEFLLINHPLDCPICDRGGECPLQDNTMKFGPGKSRFYEEKRHFKKPISLGPVLNLDRERCITCARCTRFSDLISGDHALEFIDRGFKTEVGTPDGGPVESKFIGNTIEICPVGALTSRVYRFRARPWDNKSTETTCTLCPVGCSKFLDERDGEIVRTRARENRDVNDIWLCDKGWFGYEFSNHPERLTTPLIKRQGQFESASWEEALNLIATKFKEALPHKKLAALGGNPLTLEENFLFQKLMRDGAGVNHLDHRIGMPIFELEKEGRAPGMENSIGECEALSLVVLFGLDLTEEFPVIWLRLRQAIHRGATVIFFGHYAPEIASYLKEVHLHAPGKEVEMIKQYLPTIKGFDKKAAFFVGSQYLNNLQRKAILSELIHFKEQTPHLSLNIMEGRGNSMGARLAGMRPDLGAFDAPITSQGLNAIQILEEAALQGWDYLHVAGADPASKYPSKLWSQARANLKFLVVQDLFLTQTALDADLILPTLCYTEKKGHFINIEGRLQSLHPTQSFSDGVYSDQEIFLQIAEKLNLPLNMEEFKVGERLERAHTPVQTFETQKECTGLRACFAQALFDQGVRMKHDTHLIQLAKEPFVRIHPQEGELRNLKDAHKVQVCANGHSIEAQVRFDSRVSHGTLVLPLGFHQLAVKELGPRLLNGMPMELKHVG
jgi:NADH-quinone oxidoreductase subunit G